MGRESGLAIAALCVASCMILQQDAPPRKLSVCRANAHLRSEEGTWMALDVSRDGPYDPV